MLEERMVTVNGVRLWTARQGSGPPLVLLHGGPGGWDSFDALAPMVDDLVEVHRYEQRGSGRSQELPPYSVTTFIADLEALRRYWGHERWLVGGHSAGANLAIAYAADYPHRVRALVYLSGTGVVDDWTHEYHINAEGRRSPAQRARYEELRLLLRNAPKQWTEQLNREYCYLAWMTDFADLARAPAYVDALYRHYKSGAGINIVMNRDWRRLFADSAFCSRIKALEMAVLVVHGSVDPRPVRLAERLAGSLPNATLVTLPKAGHWPWLEQPRPMRRALREFLATLR